MQHVQNRYFYVTYGKLAMIHNMIPQDNTYFQHCDLRNSILNNYLKIITSSYT